MASPRSSAPRARLAKPPPPSIGVGAVLMLLPVLALFGCAQTQRVTPTNTPAQAVTATATATATATSTALPVAPTSTPTRTSKALQPNGKQLCIQNNSGACSLVFYEYCSQSCSHTVKGLFDSISSIRAHGGMFFQMDNAFCGDARLWHLEQVGPGDNDYACFAGVDPLEDVHTRIPTPEPTAWPTLSPSQAASISATEAAGHAGCTKADALTPTSRCSGDD